MVKRTDQLREWTAEFGKQYSDRNAISLDELESMYHQRYGVTRTELNKLFLGDIDRSIRILEVGSNIGNQLLCLQRMGFQTLYGIEPQRYAVELSKRRTKGIDIIEGSAFDIPFKDGYFDLVLTSGVLIHISSSDVRMAMREIYRCSKEFIWGFEYYADAYTEIEYRGHKNLLWKADFARLYLDQFTDLELVAEERLKYLDSDNVDSMFLLRKGGKNGTYMRK